MNYFKHFTFTKNQSLKKFVVLILIFNLIITSKTIFGRHIFQPQMHSEAPIIFIDGIKMSPQLTVHFKSKVFDFEPDIFAG